MSAEHAAACRAALARAGYGRAEVSVRNDSYSMGSTIHVRIKLPTVPLEQVEAIADQHARLDRCSSTGEILSGANRFVEVSYASGVLDALAEQVSQQFAGGRRCWGSFSLSDDAGFHRSIAVWRMQGEADTERRVLRVDEDAASVGRGLARLLASAGELATLEKSAPERPASDVADEHRAKVLELVGRMPAPLAAVFDCEDCQVVS